MAEFKEILQIRQRMCDSTDRFCTGCPLQKFRDCKRPDLNEIDEYEKIIIQWAKEHPEQPYPSWAEWQRETFPDAPMVINLCNFAKCTSPCFESHCREWPIPADIAKRLGIKPKGEK